MIINIVVVVRRTWPHFESFLNKIPDHRKRKTYEVGEIMMAGLTMFMFKRQSRNNTDKLIRGTFERNYVTLWGLRLPIMETVDDFLRKLPVEELEKLKHELVRSLIRRKTLEKWRFNNRYIISIDGTGLMSFDSEPYAGCPYKTNKNDKKTWTAYALEAKLCCGNGICISLASVWLDNSENIIDDKQDCELKAFKRLAKKIKKVYPRLPIIIVADSLYPNQTSFGICQANDWDYIFTFKDGCLKSVQGEILRLKPLYEQQKNKQKDISTSTDRLIEETFEFINELEYKEKYSLNWLEYIKQVDNKTEQLFTHITNLNITKKNVRDLSHTGRLRWMIENQGFNTQKNGGYKLQHKYSRKNYGAMQNYYTLLQIAHMIMQLVEKMKQVVQMLEISNFTLIAAMEEMISTMTKTQFSEDEVNQVVNQNKQLRY